MDSLAHTIAYTMPTFYFDQFRAQSGRPCSKGLPSSPLPRALILDNLECWPWVRFTLKEESELMFADALFLLESSRIHLARYGWAVVMKPGARDESIDHHLLSSQNG